MWLQGAKAVGIAAGASAPEVLVTEVVAFLRASDPSEVEELTVIEEDVEFLLPKELVQIESRKAGKPARRAPPDAIRSYPEMAHISSRGHVSLPLPAVFCF